MRLKLDENFGTRTQRLFAAAGHDVETVRDEGLQGAADQFLYERSRGEGRCLVTLDLDFSSVTRFPPIDGPGIVIFRAPRNLSRSALDAMARRIVLALESMAVADQLWVVEATRIRVYHPRERAD